MMLALFVGFSLMSTAPVFADGGQKLAYKLVEMVYEESEKTVQSLEKNIPGWGIYGQFPQVASERLIRYATRIEGFIAPLSVILDLQQKERDVFLNADDFKILDSIVEDLTMIKNLLRAQAGKIDDMPTEKQKLAIKIASESGDLDITMDTLISIRERLNEIILKNPQANSRK